jgi:hypothetical protein
MDAEVIFLRRLDQMTQLLARGGTPVEVLELGGMLRQMLWDKHALVDAVNVNRLPLRFRVKILGDPPDKYDYHMLGRGLDPDEAGAHPRDVRVLTKNQLGQHIIGRLDDKFITVKDVVRFAANKLGAVHYDPHSSAEYELSRELYELVEHNGMPFLLQQLMPIAFVVLKGLEPLHLEVKSRA